MNKCFKCGAEFEGNFCPECGAKFELEKYCPQCNTKLDGSAKFCKNCGYSFIDQTSEQSTTTDAFALFIEKIKQNLQILFKYAPIVLFSLWAVLLWAFYSAKFTTDIFGFTDGNIYQLLKDPLLHVIHKKLQGFITIGIIANVFILVTLLALLDNKVIKLVTNVFCFAIQLSVLIYTLVIQSQLIDAGYEFASMVTIVVTFTSIFSVLQIFFICMLIRDIIIARKIFMKSKKLRNGGETSQLGQMAEDGMHELERKKRLQDSAEKAIRHPISFKDVLFVLLGLLTVIIPIIIFLLITHSI